jgi:hypothetical protein
MDSSLFRRHGAEMPAFFLRDGIDHLLSIGGLIFTRGGT